MTDKRWKKQQNGSINIETFFFFVILFFNRIRGRTFSFLVFGEFVFPFY